MPFWALTTIGRHRVHQSFGIEGRIFEPSPPLRDPEPAAKLYDNLSSAEGKQAHAEHHQPAFEADGCSAQCQRTPRQVDSADHQQGGLAEGTPDVRVRGEFVAQDTRREPSHLACHRRGNL